MLLCVKYETLENGGKLLKVTQKGQIDGKRNSEPTRGGNRLIGLMKGKGHRCLHLMLLAIGYRPYQSERCVTY